MHIRFNDTVERQLGEIVTLPDGRKAEVVEDNYDIVACAVCLMYDTIGACPNCLPNERTDRKNIIYREIKEESR